jgi:phage pi2 protein 07
MTSENNPIKEVQRYVPATAMVILNFAVFAMAALGMWYDFHDLRFPGHFIGDMYGFEVMGRLFYLVPILIFALLGFSLFIGGLRNERKGRFWTGSVFLWLSCICLIPLVKDVYDDRQEDALHKTYPQKSVEELTRLVRMDKDQYALDELMIKRTPESIKVVKQVLVDENEKTVLRICAAGWLFQFDDEEIKALLKKTEQTTKNNDLKIFLIDVRKDREGR